MITKPKFNLKLNTQQISEMIADYCDKEGLIKLEKEQVHIRWRITKSDPVKMDIEIYDVIKI